MVKKEEKEEEGEYCFYGVRGRIAFIGSIQWVGKEYNSVIFIALTRVSE